MAVKFLLLFYEIETPLCLNIIKHEDYDREGHFMYYIEVFLVSIPESFINAYLPIQSTLTLTSYLTIYLRDTAAQGALKLIMR